MTGVQTCALPIYFGRISRSLVDISRNLTLVEVSRIPRLVELGRLLVLRDTPVTPPARPPVSTNLASRDRLRD